MFASNPLGTWLHNDASHLPAPQTQVVGEVLTCGDIESVALSLVPHRSKINLRGDASDPRFSGAIESQCQVSLPANNKFNFDQHNTLLWLGPDEWQWRRSAVQSADDGSTESCINQLRNNLSGTHAAVVDVSDYYCLFQLQGTHVFDLLEKGTPLDVRSTLCEVGQCAQTRHANAAILLNTVAVKPTLQIHIQVRWSFAQYLWQYLSQGMYEFC